MPPPSWRAADGPAAAHDATPRPDDDPLATVFPDPLNPTGCDRTVVADRAAGADGDACMLPFPNDLFTVGKGAARRLNLPVAGMPKDAAGKPINPLPYSASDGFSPGSVIVVKVPGLDNPAALAATGPRRHHRHRPVRRPRRAGAPLRRADRQALAGLDRDRRQPARPAALSRPPSRTKPGQTNPAGAARADQHGQRPAADPPGDEPGQRPPVRRRPAHLKDKDGKELTASAGFAAYRDGTSNPVDAPETRRAHFEKDIFPVLVDGG